MTRRSAGRLAAPLMMLLALGAADAARADADDAAAKPVKLPAQVQQKLGLRSEPLKAKASAASLSGYVKVLDAGPLAQLDSDIEAADAAAQASAAELARSDALNRDGQTVAAKQVEAARAQARADATKLALLRRRIGLEWGDGIARLSARQRAQLLADIAAGRAALIRIDTPSGEGLAGLKSVELDLGPLGSVRATVLGPARAAEPRLLSPGLIATARGPGVRSLSIGLSTPAKLTASAAVSGVLVPRAALLRSKGETWVYVRTGPETFLRKEVEHGRSDTLGLFAPAGLKAGEQVVTQGAAALFAAETNVSEEGDEKAGGKDAD
ncbi:MAG: hypothetical protein ACXU82_02850 [Caulobacteraceae bacterium]